VLNSVFTLVLSPVLRTVLTSVLAFFIKLPIVMSYYYYYYHAAWNADAV